MLRVIYGWVEKETIRIRIGTGTMGNCLIIRIGLKVRAKKCVIFSNYASLDQDTLPNPRVISFLIDTGKWYSVDSNKEYPFLCEFSPAG